MIAQTHFQMCRVVIHHLKRNDQYNFHLVDDKTENTKSNAGVASFNLDQTATTL